MQFYPTMGPKTRVSGQQEANLNKNISLIVTNLDGRSNIHFKSSTAQFNGIPMTRCSLTWIRLEYSPISEKYSSSTNALGHGGYLLKIVGTRDSRKFYLWIFIKEIASSLVNNLIPLLLFFFTLSNGFLVLLNLSQSIICCLYLSLYVDHLRGM